MHRAFRNVARGGADYPIDDILGIKFHQFITLLNEGRNFSSFTFDPYSKKEIGSGENSPKANDIHYDFTEFLISATDEFRKIETPDITKPEVSGDFVNNISKVYDELINGTFTSGAFTPPDSAFTFLQMPFQVGKFKHLVDGFNLLPFSGQVYFDHDINQRTDLVHAIRYLRHFIALLNLDGGLNGREVIEFLTNDLHFMNYVSGIFEAFTSAGDYFSSTAAGGLSEEEAT